MSYTPPPAAVPSKRAWWKAGWFIALAAALIGGGIGAASGSSKTKTVAGPTVTTTASVTDTATVTATPTVIKTIATKVVTATVTYAPPPPSQYGAGTYVVGTDIQPGTYKTAGSDDCYWARLSSLNTSDIIDNNTGPGQQTVQILPTDKAFQVNGSCTFGKIG